jgi:hypothetical protein
MLGFVSFIPLLGGLVVPPHSKLWPGNARLGLAVTMMVTPSPRLA